jgi:UPF0755 protein
MRYTVRQQKRHWPKRILGLALVLAALIMAATLIARQAYHSRLEPANSADQQAHLVTISSGESVDAIAQELCSKGLIRSPWAFSLYVSSQQDRSALEAGTYNFSPSENVQEIVAQLSHGKIAANLVTILPGQRLSQVEQAFKNDGFSSAQVTTAFADPAQYAEEPVMQIEPAGTPLSLEGMLYPDSFQKDTSTTLTQVVQESLQEMNKQLSPSVRSAFQAEGLTPYQGLILASIVEQEVSTQSDRNQVAQVFLSRLAQNVSLGSDVTAYYGALLAGQNPSVSYDSPYNTLLHTGLPPTPIATVSQSSINAVAHPAKTSWLYFVTGDNGITYFSKTLAEHQQLTQQYCHKLCSE